MPKVTELWAYVVEEFPGEEGVPAVPLHGLMYPLFGADAERMKSMEKFAQMMADATGVKVELRRFSSVEVVKVLNPKKKEE